MFVVVNKALKSCFGKVNKDYSVSQNNLIGFALNHPEYLKKILDHKVGLINQEEDFALLEDTDLLPDQNVFCV